MLQLIVWTNIPTFYQADLFRALTKMSDVHLKVVFEKEIPEDRRNLGWQNDTSGFEYEFLSEHHPAFDAIRKARKHRTNTHIVGGLWASTVQEAVLATLFASGARYFIYSEAPDPRDIVPPIKRKILMVLGKRVLNGASGILPISHFAMEYFKSYGIGDSKFYPFGYFRSQQSGFRKKVQRRRNKSVNILFVGQLGQRKGIDILLSAMQPLFAAKNHLQLKLIGSGELETQYQDWVRERNLSSRVTFEGVIDSKLVIRRISEADMLVLPSRWDGWGIVVNEALMAGVPVIVSNMCGAADIVNDGRNGFIFNSEDIQELRTKLNRFVTDRAVRARMKEEARKTGSLLGAEAAARYLVDVLSPDKERGKTSSTVYPWVRKTLSR